jgi:hypothetical protein
MKAIRSLLFLLTILLLLACIVYWFNIKSDGKSPKKGFMTIVAAGNTENDYFFKLADDTYIRLTSTDPSGNKWTVESIGSYGMTAIPYCLVCGWNKPVNGNFLQRPYYKDGYFYSDIQMYEWNGKEDGHELGYPILDSKTMKWSFLRTEEELKQKGLLFDEQYRPNANEIAETYPSISMYKESCLIVLSAFFFLYLILVPIYLILYLRSRKKKIA